MSKIAEQRQKLRELEIQLALQERKIEFLNHILASAQKYNHKDFNDVKDEVVKMLAAFVKRATEVIEGGNAEPLLTPVPPVQKDLTVSGGTFGPENGGPSQPVKPRLPTKETDVPPNVKLSFAMDNRHLSGKTVTVANDKNMVIKGKVVGLDAPYVLVATETGPTIKVPLEHVSLT